MSPLPYELFEIFTSGRYHIDRKILKILASNSKRFRFFSIFKKWQIDDRGGGQAKYYIFSDKFCLKQSLVLKFILGMFFDSKNSKMTSKWS